jgi:hypothetical protein
MSIARFPSQIVIEDSDDNTELAIVTMDDGAAALVEIKSSVSAACWPELSEQILGALRDMRLDGDSV